MKDKNHETEVEQTEEIRVGSCWKERNRFAGDRNKDGLFSCCKWSACLEIFSLLLQKR